MRKATRINKFNVFVANIFKTIAQRGKSIRAVGLITFSSLFATGLGVVGSLVQAGFISPDDLGFVRKYSIIPGYAVFLSLGLFTILQREYPVLIGHGKPEQARRTAAIVQSWSLLTAAIVCGGLTLLTIAELFQGHWREASAWFIQIITVWAALYVGYLTCTFRSGEEFERLAKGSILASVIGVGILPLFWLMPFPALVLRSVVGQIVNSIYLHVVRPVKVGWCLPWKEWGSLVKRGIRLYVGTYLRQNFWLTVEIWAMFYIAGDKGVGLLVFSKLIADSIIQLPIAINLVYMPRLAQMFGRTGSVEASLRFVFNPALINLGISVIISIVSWAILPTIIIYAFPKYVEAIPLLRIFAFQAPILSTSVPLYMVMIVESYLTQIIAALVGLLFFVGTFLGLHFMGVNEISVAWGSLVGQMVFTAICLFFLQRKINTERKSAAIKA